LRIAAATKQLLANGLCRLGVDGLFRYINRRKLLVVMYHGVTRMPQKEAPWTQLPEAVFAEQIEFLSTTYRLLSLSELIDCIRTRRDPPEGSALITFDDGLRNNLTVAFPILKRFSAPSAIFLATDFIGSRRFYWFDELYLILLDLEDRREATTEIARQCGVQLDTLSREETYSRLVEHFKRLPETELTTVMAALRGKSTCDLERFKEDFTVLDWPEIDYLNRTGLVEFGVHTAGHKILSSLSPERWDEEIRIPRRVLSRALGREVVTFAYPNGKPEIDYSEVHKSYLEESGYLCAFNTSPSLATFDSQSAFDLSRIPTGNDLTSHPGLFRLMSSGCPGLLRST
jgi:peptidoglycan/xylan/chitin deacetylase (PgdA/CDA1 family)